MTLAKLVAVVLDAKNIYIAALVIAGLLLALVSATRVPAQLQQHITQSDSIKNEQRWTNKKLDVLICLQAKLDTPIRCVAQEK